MKRIQGVGLLWAALALAANASAQDLPPQFVISGETARRIHDFTTINLATAERIAETCERLARHRGQSKKANHFFTGTVGSPAFFQSRIPQKCTIL